MHLQESGEMYLETVFILSQKSDSVRSIDICEYMGYSKPSVSRAIGLLKNGGFITVDGKGYIALTEEGKSVAVKMFERHTIITDFLVKLGVDKKTAAEDACKIEHHISEESFNALKQYALKREEHNENR